MILDMSGNVGTQSLAVTIRVLMDEELKPGDKWRLIRKEGGAGFFNGLILGGIAVLGIGFYIYAVKSYDALTAFGISSCIGLSLVLAMFISSLVGPWSRWASKRSISIRPWPRARSLRPLRTLWVS